MTNMKPRPKPKHLSEPGPATDPESFAFTLMKAAVSQICLTIGYTATRPSALTALTRIAALYLQTVSKAAATGSNTSGRTESNLFDLINALRDVVLPSQQGCFPGAASGDGDSNGNSCLLRGSASLIDDVRRFVRFNEEIPFAKPVPRATDLTLSVAAQTASQRFKGPPLPHVPQWLPGFPDPVPFRGGETTTLIKKKRELWEEERGSVREGVAGNKRINGGDLAMERRRVRFKIG